MVLKVVKIDTSRGQYLFVFNEDVDTSFLKIKVVEVDLLGRDKVVLVATIRWRNFTTLKIFGSVRAEHTGLVLGTIEREFEQLLIEEYRCLN